MPARDAVMFAALFVGASALSCAPAPRPGVDDTKVVTDPAATWDELVIDGDVGARVGVSAMLDARGRLHVAWNPNRDAVRIATVDGGSPSIVTLEDGADGEAWAPRLALGRSRAPGGPSVVPAAWTTADNALPPDVFVLWSRRFEGEVRLAHVVDGVGAPAIVARTSGAGFSSTSIEVDADGAPRLAWLAGVMDMMYAPRLQHSWPTGEGQFTADEIADAALDEGTALAFDADGTLHALYFDRALYHAAREDDVWRTEFIGEMGDGVSPALAAAPDGALFVLCGGTGARAGEWRDGTWTFTALEEGEDAGRHGSLVVDGDGRLHALWVTDGALRYMTRDESGAFRIEPIDVALAPDTTPALAVARDGTPQVIAPLVRDGATALVRLSRKP